MSKPNYTHCLLFKGQWISSHTSEALARKAMRRVISMGRGQVTDRHVKVRERALHVPSGTKDQP